MVMTPDWESVSCEFKYRNFCFYKERFSLIRLILNSKYEKKQFLQENAIKIPTPVVTGVYLYMVWSFPVCSPNFKYSSAQV